jgi:steroid 5-alpha reductase family enzyme
MFSHLEFLIIADMQGCDFQRSLKYGGDSRFDEVKRDPAKFTALWMAQGLRNSSFTRTWFSYLDFFQLLGYSSSVFRFIWYAISHVLLYGSLLIDCSSPKANTMPTNLHPPLGPRDYAAFGLFASSFILEAVADRQKSVWRSAKENKEHDEKFITKGLWGISRHPKFVFFWLYDSIIVDYLNSYVGEVGIWTGIWALSAGSIQTGYYHRYAPFLTLVSPLTTYVLLRDVSQPRFSVRLTYQFSYSSFLEFLCWR